MRLLIGCPVYQRDWILPKWFVHVEASCRAAKVVPEYLFLCDKTDPSRTAAEAFCSTKGRTLHFGEILEVQKPPRDEHAWYLESNLHRMVSLRNLLLEDVRLISPDRFLSLDSDILLAKKTISQLLETIEEYDVVGGKCYMSPGRDNPSWGTWSRNGGLRRQDADGVFPVDVVMAIKLMSPPAYHIDYVFDIEGEDIGWSRRCREESLTLGWDGRTVNKHVLEREQVNVKDNRCGF